MPPTPNGPALLPDLLRALALQEPDRLAVRTDGGTAVSYAEWERQSNALARGLVALGVRPGDRVGLYFRNSSWADYAVAFLGTAKASGIAVPLSDRFAGPQLEDILSRAAVTHLITGPDPAPVRRRQHQIAEVQDGQPPDSFQAPADPGDVVEILYTSGTTGLPKGVACTHAHAILPLGPGSGWPPEFWRQCAGGTYLHANAVSTAAGQLRILDALGPQRMTLSALPAFDAERMCQLATEHRAAVIQLVPGMASAILETGAAGRYDLSCIRVVSLGCAAFPPSLIPGLAAAFPSAQLVNMYELSEARHVGTSMVHDGATRLASVGLPRGRTDVLITDESGAEVPAGSVGEIRLRWRGLAAQRYWSDAAASAEVFEDGWTRTGDAGYLDPDGYLFITDRIKDVIIKGGTSISAQLIESALLTHPAVAEATVFGVPDPWHGELVHAAVVVRTAVAPEDLRAFLAGRVARLEVPDQIRIVTELPRNQSGKVLKRELRAQATPAGQPGLAQYALTAIWAEVLHQDSIGPDDDFLALGGDSLRATQVGARLRDRYGIELPVAVIFENPRLADLAAVIGGLMNATTEPPIEPIPRLARPAAADGQP